MLQVLQPYVVYKERNSKVWKQITTQKMDTNMPFMLFTKNVIPKFESKSQRRTDSKTGLLRCLQRT